MEDQKNFLTAMILMGILMMGYMYYGSVMAEKAKDQNQIEQQDQAVREATVIKPLAPRESVLKNGQRIKIDTPSLSGSFLVEGSRFDDIELKNYKQTLDKDSEAMVLLRPEGTDHAAYVFDNWVPEGGGSGANTAWSVMSGSTLTMETPVILSHEGNGFRVERTVSIDDRYLITLDDVVTNTSGAELTLTRKGASRQHGLPEDLTNFFILHEGAVSIVDGKLVDMKYKKLSKKRAETAVGESGWAGLTDKYWLAAAIAPQGKPMRVDFNYRLLNDIEVYEAGYALDATTLTPGASIASKGFVFAGAKDRSVLIKYQDEIGIAQMERAIDWGFLRLLTRPMTQALSFLGNKIGNFGVGILVLTFIIKVVLFPLYNKQYASQAKMKKVQPKIKKMQKLYGDDRVKLQQEMMAMYKKEGVNPVAGVFADHSNDLCLFRAL